MSVAFYSNPSMIFGAQSSASSCFGIDSVVQRDKGNINDGSSKLVRNWDGTIHLTEKTPAYIFGESVAPLIRTIFSVTSSIWKNLPSFTLPSAKAETLPLQCLTSHPFLTPSEPVLGETATGRISQTVIARETQIITDHDLVLLETIDEIRRFIQAQFPLALADNRKPDGYWKQLKTGLVLKFQYGCPKTLVTPFGELLIFNGGVFPWKHNFNQALANIQKSLNLELVQEEYNGPFGPEGPSYAIRKWNDQKIELPLGRRRNDFLSESRLENIWRKFASRHPISKEPER